MFKFNSLNHNDLTLIYQWFQEPFVNRWYARGKHWSFEAIREKYEPRILGQENVPSFIIYKDEIPIGFIQYYQFEHGFPEGIYGRHNLLFKQYKQADLVGIDLFIAEQNMRGKGFGVKIINQFIKDFLIGFSAAVVDPQALNSNAIKCYEQSGFMKTSFSEDPNYLVMVKQLINPEVLREVKNILQTRFETELNIESIDFLSEPERRNSVLRITLERTKNGVPDSIILKQSLPEQSDADDKEADARFARDWASLEFLSSIPQPAHNVPKFYGASKQQRFILIEDLGQQHVSLVDSLTAPDQKKAIAALTRFMKALGSFHATTFGHTEHYEKLLHRIHENAETVQEELDFILKDLLPKLESAKKQLNVPVTQALIDEAKDIITTMLSPSPFTVLTHGDICPDNVFDHEGKDLQLIDFEWSFVRNALLDGTYLRMSMPTCWCAKAIPLDVIESLEIIYREELKRTIPAANDDVAYNIAYTKACGFWVLQQTLPYLEGILLQERIGPSGPVPEGSLWKSEDNTVRPRFLSRLQSFVDVATKNNTLPHLKEMSKNILVAVEARWPDTMPLAVYPAFMNEIPLR
ncbi:GNAT family N-acetyltransferase [Legionella quateirensis]|uniref:Aminoglycoside 6'-N-acetyltransferase n=1 Tax=Legionella quateirensis TaxID=45072 RepID=A0A378KP71_9GAMM|nr:GNAT family N-acetyltransferase [Legionella quateirensis]KTD52888.1 aminoglycoside 6'-N-acetyltransferase [Legionella quateirensis]STY16382.1 aminoglycoside 6'-N-acetyltransferase [Legionella quateirensis]